MKRKIIGFLAALVLAGIGTAALVVYVESAKDQAVAAEAMVDVYVVSETIPKGTPVGEITRVGRGDRGAGEGPGRRRRHRPRRRSTTSSSPPSTSRPASSCSAAGSCRPTQLSRGSVPAGLQELTVALDPTRAVGGTLAVGDTVGVVLSFEPFDLPASEDQSPNTTHLTFHKVVVTAVQFAEGDGGSTERRLRRRGGCGGHARPSRRPPTRCSSPSLWTRRRSSRSCSPPSSATSG